MPIFQPFSPSAGNISSAPKKERNFYCRFPSGLSRKKKRQQRKPRDSPPVFCYVKLEKVEINKPLKKIIVEFKVTRNLHTFIQGLRERVARAGWSTRCPRAGASPMLSRRTGPSSGDRGGRVGGQGCAGVVASWTVSFLCPVINTVSEWSLVRKTAPGFGMYTAK